MEKVIEEHLESDDDDVIVGWGGGEGCRGAFVK